MIKKILLSIFVSLCSIVFSLAVIEVGFRVMTFKKQGASWNDRPKQYFIHENSPSFQDYPYAEVKPEGTYRIAVIGDSFTFAPYMQFDDAFPKRLERMLNLNAGQKKVEVINYGVPAYSTNHEVPVVQKAIEEGADFVLMQITFNDPEIKPYTPEQLHRDRNKFGELKLDEPIYHYWKSLGFVKQRLHNNITHDNYVKKFFNLFERKRTWENFSNSWKKIKKITDEKQVPTAAVVFPLFGIPLDEKYPFHPIHAKIKEFLTTLGVRSHDLYTDYEGIPLERLQVIVGQDFHPNEIGHRLAAESILRWWTHDHIVPAEFLPKVSSPERIGIRKPGTDKDPKTAIVADPNITDEGDVIDSGE